MCVKYRVPYGTVNEFSRVTDMPCHELGRRLSKEAESGGGVGWRGRLSLVDILERGMLEEKKRGEERTLYWLGSVPTRQAGAACRAGPKLKSRLALAAREVDPGCGLKCGVGLTSALCLLL